MKAPHDGPLVFVAHAGTRRAEVPGGVQLCTQEFLESLTLAGFDIRHFEAPLSNGLVKRLKQRLGAFDYAQADILSAAPALIRFIEREGATRIVINMTNLAGFAAPLRRRFGAAIRIALISHGNESGDHLRELANGRTGMALRRSAYRLGRELIDESSQRWAIDHVFCLSETEKEIEHWLGALSASFVPRLVRNQPLDWRPRAGRIGYVGTLDHFPNREGLGLFLEALHRAGHHDLHIRVVGGPRAAGEEMARHHKSMEYLGPLPTPDLLAEAATWAMFVHPLFWYARGASMKIAQAIGWGIPVLTTVPGARGYSWTQGELLMADSADHMASIAADVARSSDRQEVAAANVRRVRQSTPTDRSIAAMLKSGIDGCVSNSRDAAEQV